MENNTLLEIKLTSSNYGNMATIATLAINRKIATTSKASTRKTLASYEKRLINELKSTDDDLVKKDVSGLQKAITDLKAKINSFDVTIKDIDAKSKDARAKFDKKTKDAIVAKATEYTKSRHTTPNILGGYDYVYGDNFTQSCVVLMCHNVNFKWNGKKYAKIVAKENA